jgi:predicted porin
MNQSNFVRVSKAAVLCAASVGTSSVFAQSSVTLFGLLDEGVRFATNQSSSSGPANRIYMVEGPQTGNRWGLRGIEQLGDGTAVVFQLESGFNVATGASDQQGQLFGRQAFIGLTNTTYGSLKLGRQYGVVSDFMAAYDPAALGNVTANVWEIYLAGLRFDNTAKYNNQFGPVAIELQHSFGGQTSGFNVGSTDAAQISYTAAGLSGALIGQKSKDALGHNLWVGVGGASYTFSAFKLYSYLMWARRDPGFVAAANNSGLALANTNLIGNATTAAGGTPGTRTDHVGVMGLGYAACPDLYFTLGGAYDKVSNVDAGNNGHFYSIYGIATYSLSKRTDVNLEVDRSQLSGASVTDPNGPLGSFGGKNNSTGAMITFRTRF